jgi:hypothetical protein
METSQMRAILSALKGILTTAGRVLGGLFGIFCLFLAAISAACFRQPSVPPAADNGDATAQVARIEEANSVKSWAAAKLNGHAFTVPPGRLAGWLGSLDEGHAMRIAPPARTIC